MGIVKNALLVLALPAILVVVAVVLALWALFTVTGIGPVLNWIGRYYDREFLVPPKDVKLLHTPQGYRLAVRYSGWAEGASQPRRHFPISIPNGLAASALATSSMHENLVAAGFEVVSFDRYGVGWSDDNDTGRSPTVDECVRDAFFCMKCAMPEQDKWLLLGPSMGSIVAQCMIAQQPDRIVGLLNMDGFAAAFETKRGKFMSARKLWWLMGLSEWTGILRLGMKFVSSQQFASQSFSAAHVKAQMSSSRMYFNTYLEFPLMLDLAESASNAWGPLAVSRMPADEVRSLARVAPIQNGIFENGQWTTLPRSRVELGDSWLSDEETREIEKVVRSKTPTTMSDAWSRLAVRVMSGRNYDYAGGDSFYDLEMKETSVAEGNLQAMIAGDGARYAFPSLGHDKMFLAIDAIVQCMVDIDDAAAKLGGISR